MINKFLGRLPNEDHIGYLISQKNVRKQENSTTTFNDQGYPKDSVTNELLLGEQFLFAYETDEFTEMTEVMGQHFIENTLPMEIITSSNLEFKVGDKVVFENRTKLIIGVTVRFTREDINVSIGFNPTVRRHHTVLTLD